MEPNEYINKLIAEQASFDDLAHMARNVMTVCEIPFQSAAIIIAARAEEILMNCNFAVNELGE